VLPREIPKAEAMPMPFVTAFEPATGRLDLGSPTLRADWHDGGVLEFRSQRYRFVALVSHAAPWVYRFEALPSAVAQDLPRLRLTPPQPPAPAPPQTERISILGDALKMTAFAFAPGPSQREWELAHHLPPLALTLASAGLELAGGVSNLAREGPRDIAFALLDLFLIGEGALRLALVALRREPCGSVFGLPLRGLYRRWLAAAQVRGVPTAQNE
jgi:hypothetical protein